LRNSPGTELFFGFLVTPSRGIYFLVERVLLFDIEPRPITGWVIERPVKHAPNPAQQIAAQAISNCWGAVRMKIVSHWQ
jgi:hypothetical protein